MGAHIGLRTLVRGAPVLRDGRPPLAQRRDGGEGPGQRELRHPVGPRGDPEVPLRPDHARKGAVQHLHDPLGHEGPAGAIDEGGDAVLLRLGGVVREAVELLGPLGVLVGAPEVEEARAHDRVRRDVGVVRLDDPRVRVQAADDLARGIDLLGARVGDLVDDHDVRELDLVGQEVDERALVLLAPRTDHRLAAVAQEVVAGVVAQQVHRVDDRHHRIELGHVGEALAVLVAEVEGGRHRQRLGDAGRLDQEVVEPPFAGETAHLLKEIVAQSAADAAVRHLDQGLVGMAKVRPALAHEVGVDVHLGHVVDDHRDSPTLAVVEHPVQQRRLTSAQEPGQDGDGKAGIRHRYLLTTVGDMLYHIKP